MTIKRIMLLGANGQMGQALLAEKLPSDWQVSAYSHADLDIGQHPAVQQAMRKDKPDFLINCAAITNVDNAESDPHKAIAINFNAVANIAAHASAMDVPVLHLSTDYVFDGIDHEIPYKTDDQMHPLNVYGDSKMMGEEALRQHHAWHIILRISSVFSAYGKNLLTNALDQINKQDEVKSVTDIRSAPTYAPDAAKAMIAMVSAVLKGKHDGFGVFHYCGTPAASRYEFTQAIMKAFEPYTDRRPTITPAKRADFTSRAERPAYSVLDCAKIRNVYGIEQKSWEAGLPEAIGKLMLHRKKHA